MALLIADDFHPDLMSGLEKAGIDFTYLPGIDRQGILRELQAGASGLIFRSKTVADAELFEAGKCLKFIGRGGAGMDNIDIGAASAAGVFCFNAGNANSDAVAEQAVGMLISLFRKIHTADAEVRNGIWQREANRGLELGGKVIGIVGYGNTGSAFARKLKGFDMEILAYDKYKKGFGNSWVRECSMEELYQNAEIVSFHVPLDSQTSFMVNSDYLQRFVRNIFLLNLSRGGILHTQDVVDLLRKGKISGFAADVLEHENPPAMGVSDRKWFDELVKMKQVVLTPHVAGWTAESYQKISLAMLRGIMQFLQAG